MTGRILALALAAAGAWAAVEAWRRMPLGTPADPGPGLLPFLLASALVALAVATVFLPGEAGAPVAWRPALAVAALLVAYPLLLPHLGFAVTTCLALVLLARSVARRSPVQLAAFALLATAGAVLLFQKLLSVPLPRGPWGF